MWTKWELSCGAVGLWGLADMGPGRYGAWPTRGLAETGRTETGRDEAGRPTWERRWQLSLENSKINQNEDLAIPI